jgi:glycosyltransferase involved in cell wall biosynthesis
MNPRAGGAEFVTFEIARRLVQQGHSVEWFSASFRGADPEETFEGIRIVRAGRQWSVHWCAFQRYRGKLARDFDVVIDETNTIPFFTPLWSDIPMVMFIHQLAREVWWYETSFPLSALGFVAEPLYLRIYRHVPVLTVSSSTRDDLRRLGFKGSICILPEGLEPITEVQVDRPSTPAFLYVGRLAPSKRVADIIRAFARFCTSVESAELSLLGDGPEGYVQQLRNLAASLGVSEQIRFLGRVSRSEKHHEMARAHVLLLASVREGWGLVVTEANALGTPAVAYDVPGLRDSIRHDQTGLLTRPSPDALADAMIRLWVDRNLYRRLAAGAVAWSSAFSFDNMTDALQREVATILFEARDQQRFKAHMDG